MSLSGAFREVVRGVERHAMVAALAFLVLGASSLGAQDTMRVATAGEKSPAAARLIGIFPGAGHLYAGETGRGFAYMGGTLAIFLIGATMMVAECYAEVLGAGERCESSNTDDIATAAVLGLWGWSIYDAGRAAHRTKAKRRRERVALIVVPARPTPGAPRGGSRLRVGLSLATP
jgi:hypothetical protein